MRKSLLSISFILISIYLNSQTWQWAESAGLDYNTDMAFGIATDALGNVYHTGSFKSPTITFGTTILTNAGSEDLFIVKYDANGNVIWAKNFGSTGNDFGVGIVTDSNGNVFVTGGFFSPSISFGSFTLTNVNAGMQDIFVVKYDSNGNVLWAKSAGGNSSERANGITTDSNGNVYITGGFYSSSVVFNTINLTNVGNTSWDVYIAKYDTNGNVIWAKSFGGSSTEIAEGIATDINGNTFITGNFISHLITIGADSLINASAGKNDLFIVKYDTNGNVLWAKSAGGTDWENAADIAVDVSGNAYLLGDFESPSINFGSTIVNRVSS